MKFEEIITSLKQKKYKPIYFLEGEEPYFIDEISNYIEQNALSDAEKSFNQSVLYGKDSNWKQVLDTVMRFPMMSAFQVVILKEAADLKDIENLSAYFEKPLPSTIFVVCHKNKKLDKRKTFGKNIGKNPNVVHFESEPIKEWDIEKWIQHFVQEKGFKMKAETQTMLKEYLGADLAKIANELSKLFLNIPKEKEITSDDVEKYIGISKDYNVYEFQKSLGKKNTLLAYQFVKYSEANDKANPLVLVIASLYNYFSKILILQNSQGLNEKEMAAAIGIYTQFPKKILDDYALPLKNYSGKKIEKVFSILHEFDLKSKGINYSGGNHAALLNEMTAKILSL